MEDIPLNNRRFYSEPFWTPEKSGQWFCLATAVDTRADTVAHYVNGRRVPITDGTNREKPLPKLRIGHVDLGNWSKPIWARSIRTLNGRVDEFALFKAALSDEEIKEIYEAGRPDAGRPDAGRP